METNAKRNAVLIGIAVALGGFAVYRFVSTESTNAALPREFTIAGVCVACKTETSATVEVRKRPPLLCAGCKKEAVYMWMYCPDCKHRFIPTLVKTESGLMAVPVVPACPGCRGAHGTQYEPKDPEQQPKGDLPLPKWG